MKPYLLSLAVGLLVGVIYALLGVRSPAPPAIALIGLLGILAGEQVVPLATRLSSHEPVTVGWIQDQCLPHVFGRLPEGSDRRAPRRQPDEATSAMSAGKSDAS